MQDSFVSRFSYTRIDGVIGATALTEANGEPLESIIQGNLGIHRTEHFQVSDKYLYDAFVYDSDLEKANIKNSGLKEVEVFGKIPRCSIKVPLYFGGTTSPDFMYVLRTPEGALSLNFIVETKDVKTRNDLRGVEVLKIKAAKKFFEFMQQQGIRVRFEPQLKQDDIVVMLQQLLAAQ